MVNKNQKAHLIGIAGAGMSALAILLKETGWKVTGSDNGSYEPISGYLKKHKISFFKTYSAKNIPKDANLIIIGKHAELTKSNPEVAQAFKSGIKIQSLPEALAHLSKDKENLIVAGSFGKSTCTALVAWCLEKAKKNPSYFIGAIPIDLKQSSHLGKGKEFVIEGDEYPSSNTDARSKFLHFNPSSVLLISALHDHLNIFPTEKSYVEPYKKLMTKIPKNGLLVFAWEGKNTIEVAKDAKCKTISYALKNNKADWYTENIKYGVTTSFDLMNKGKKITNVKTKLLGNHNLENIIGVGAFLLEQNKVTPAEFTKTIASFSGIKRRIELKNPKGKIPVYEGLGSSYEKAKVIFDTLKLHFPQKRIIAVFEPHTFSWRNRAALKWYKDIFDGVGDVILLPPPEHGKADHDQLSFDEIYNEIRKNVSVHKESTEKEALALVKKIAKKGDIIALVSSGSLLGLSKSVPKMFS